MSKRWWISFILVASSILWGTLVLVLLPAYASEFGSSTITNSTTTNNTSSIPDWNSEEGYGSGGGEGDTGPGDLPNPSSQSSRVISDYTQLGILLSIVLVAVLATVAYFAHKKK